MIKQYIVDLNESGQRLDKFLAELYSHYSRSQMKQFLKAGSILVNQTIQKPSYLIQENDVITFEIEAVEEVTIEPEPINLDIIYEDEDIIVLIKPTGMVVHPAPGHYSNTLVNALLYYTEHLSTLGGEERPGIVHRLDKDTSGILVVAKDNNAHYHLKQQFKAKSTLREYVAIVYGYIKEDEGTINAPIMRSSIDRKKMAVDEAGKEAVTHYQVIERLGNFTYVKCQLETGRTHQIRVHMSYMGHPIVGDDRYGPRKVIGKMGQYLHAKKIGFNHPRTNEWMVFEAPIPEYFEKYLEQLRIKATH